MVHHNNSDQTNGLLRFG